jgi:hypothetical protein
MEDSEEKALDRFTHKPFCWFRYVDNTFIMWPHGPGRLRHFPDHLNSVHHTTEQDGHLSFLDMDIYSRPDASDIKYTVNLPIPTCT